MPYPPSPPGPPRTPRAGESNVGPSPCFVSPGSSLSRPAARSGRCSCRGKISDSPRTPAARAILVAHLTRTRRLERATGGLILWLVQRAGQPIKFYRRARDRRLSARWSRWPRPGRLPPQRSAELERPGVPWLASMKTVGHDGEHLSPGAIAEEGMLRGATTPGAVRSMSWSAASLAAASRHIPVARVDRWVSRPMPGVSRTGRRPCFPLGRALYMMVNVAVAVDIGTGCFTSMASRVRAYVPFG